MSFFDRIFNKNNGSDSSKVSKSSLTIDILRVVPIQEKLEKNSRTDRLTDLLIVLFIFGIAMWFRFYVRFEFIAAYTESFFHITIKEGDPLNFGKFLGLKPGDHVETEGYVDYSFYYIDYVNAFVDKGWNPYSGNLEEGDVLNGYVYGPIYIYLISIGKSWFDLSAEQSIIYSNLIFDSLSYVMVYMLAKRVTGNIIAMFIAMIGSFSPIALFYASIRVLNAPQMNFFTLLFIYFFLEHRDGISMFVLAIATLTKQFPLFFVMPLGFFMVRRYGILKGTTFIILYFVFVLLLSVPWIVLTYTAYVTKLFLPGGAKPAINCPQGGEAVNLVAGTIKIESCETDEIVISQMGAILFELVNSHYLFFGSLFILAWAGFTGYDYMEKNPKLYLRFFTAYLALSHATIARGIYKYYLTFLVPFFLLALVPGDINRSAHLRLGALINRGWSTWIHPKFRMKKPNIDYWLLFFVLIGSTLGIFWLIDSAVVLFAPSRKYHILWLFILIPLSIYFMIRPGPIDITQSEEHISLIRHEIADLVKFGLAISLSYIVFKLAQLYFSDDTISLRKNQNIVLVIVFLLMTLPYMINSVTKTDQLFNSFNIEFLQIIFDLIGLAINFYFFYFINKEILLIHRYYTTSIILAASIFFMGLLGGEVWSSCVVVPYNAFHSFIRLINSNVSFTQKYITDTSPKSK